MIVLIIYNFGCVSLPDADMCIANAGASKIGCYNLHNDYTVVNNRLVLNPGAQPHYKPLNTVSDVDKWTMTDPDSWAKIKAWAQSLQDRCSTK